MNKTKVILILAFVLASLNTLFMPNDFYRGDSTAIKFAAINLVKNFQFGISAEKKDDLQGLLVNKGQYYHENSSNNMYYSRWGFFNTLISALPEFFISHSDDKLRITKKSVLAHNILNVVLATTIGVLLFLIVSFYTSSVWASIVFVLSTLYSTYLFNYLRVQSYEIQQICLLLLAFYSAKKFRIQNLTRWLLLIYLSIAALVLIKDFYFLFVPPFFFYLFGFDLRKYKRAFFLKSIAAFLLPVGIILIANKWQFQQFFFTNKASHIPYDTTFHPFAFHYFYERVYDHLLNLQASIFIYCPMLLFSILGVKVFWAKFKRDFLLISFLFVLVLIPILFYYSYGEWCYGPRLIVIAMPLLTLPSAILIERVFVNEYQKWKRGLIAFVFFSVCLLSFKFQLEYNSRPFFMKYDLEARFSTLKNNSIDMYFKDMPLFVVAQDFNAYVRAAEPFFPLEVLLLSIPDHQERLREVVFIFT